MSPSPEASKMEEDQPQAGSSMQAEPAPKRQRLAVDEKKRSQRMFGNILGTLNQFKKEDKSRNASEAAKRREITANRIAAKIRSETSLHQDIADYERELKTLRISTETSEFVLSHKQNALKARHANLRHVVHFLHTSKPPGVTVVHEGVPIVPNPSPLPLAQGPPRQPPAVKQAQPLYFLPKVLLPHQETLLSQQKATVDSLIEAEVNGLRSEEQTVETTVDSNQTKIKELTAKLDDLRQSMPAKAGAAPSASPNVREREREREASAMEVDEPVKVQGENGDEDVEY